MCRAGMAQSAPAKGDHRLDTLPSPETGFHYAALEPDACATAREAADKIRMHGQRAAESIVSMGAVLSKS